MAGTWRFSISWNGPAGTGYSSSMETCDDRPQKNDVRVGLAVLLVAANAPRLGAQASPGSAPYIDAEHGLTIEELVTLALQHSPAVAATTARIDVARGNLAQASARANPAATIGGATELGGPQPNHSRRVVAAGIVPARRATDLAKREVNVMVFDARASEWQLAAMVRRQAANALAAVAAWICSGRKRGRARAAGSAGRGVECPPRLEADVVEIETRRIEAAALRQDGEVGSSIAVLRGLNRHRAGRAADVQALSRGRVIQRRADNGTAR